MNIPRTGAFTLIELSIVIVIIGLIVGGVLVGRDLISAAGVRAQIAQIESFQQATNTFRGKYGFLPGDIKEPDASNFGFTLRGENEGEGDGDGLICGNKGDGSSSCSLISMPINGEQGMFWKDLHNAKLVAGKFEGAGFYEYPCCYSGNSIGQFLPAAKTKGWIYAWSGGYSIANASASNGVNYFTLTEIQSIDYTTAQSTDTPSLTVRQAYSIDAKIDDGLPQAGTVLALTGNSWAGGGGTTGTMGTGATTASSNTCYDNSGVGGAVQKYSINYNNGGGLNCSLTFKMQ